MAEMMYREALNRALIEEMQRDPLVFVMGENIAKRGGSFTITSGLLEKFGPQRVIDTPLAEVNPRRASKKEIVSLVQKALEGWR